EFQQLRAQLRRDYDVVDVDLSSGKPPLDADVLIVAKPKGWTEQHEIALDQYLMSGGKVIAFMDTTELAKQTGRGSPGPTLQPLESGRSEEHTSELQSR